jgi:hypothetical protein
MLRLQRQQRLAMESFKKKKKKKERKKEKKKKEDKKTLETVDVVHLICPDVIPLPHLQNLSMISKNGLTVQGISSTISNKCGLPSPTNLNLKPET